MAEKGNLVYVSPDAVSKNPENPRMIFRDDEMQTLVTSIAKNGIQVPITVYKERGKYFLIDGERRWRSALKLNLLEIPAYVQDKPTPLQNLVLMYNIHALREQWDYFTIAAKIPRIEELYEEEHGRRPTEAQLSELTGLTRGQIRRCRFLADLPEKYKNLLLDELRLPKSQQKLSEDFFIEMERSLRAVLKRFPALKQSENKIRDTLIQKYRDKVINNVTEFRMLSKIATSMANFDVPEKTARQAIEKIFNAKNSVSVAEVYAGEFEFYYDEKKALRYMAGLIRYIDAIIDDDFIDDVDPAFRKEAEKLYKRLKKMLEG